MTPDQLARALDGIELTYDPKLGVVAVDRDLEVVAAHRDILLPAYFGASQRPGMPGKWWQECPHCKNWRLAEKDPTNCPACTKSFEGARVATFTWAGANRYGRPPHPWYGSDEYKVLKKNQKAAKIRGGQALAATRGRVG